MLVSTSRIVFNCSRSRSSFALHTHLNQQNKLRCFTMTRAKHMALKKETDKLRTYVVKRYIDYVKNYTNALEIRFPNAVKMYRVFSVGIKDFLTDLKTYISLRVKKVRDQGFSNMSRQEIELYQKMPSEMIKIAPVLILSAIPFGNYVIFPLAFWKPKSLLCSHFWSIQQRSEFTTQELAERLKYNKPVFRALQAKVDSITDGSLKMRWQEVIAALGSGVHPKIDTVLSCKELFVNDHYQLKCLSRKHLGYLLKIHGLSKYTFFRVHKLKYRAFLLLEMDKAILREGGVDKLNTDTLRYACHLRGLNGSHLTNKDMRNWLQKWLTISENVDKSSYSLLLHCPILLAYNNPQNWVLIH